MEKIKYITWSKEQVAELRKIGFDDRKAMQEYANNEGRTIQSVLSKRYRIEKGLGKRKPKKASKTFSKIAGRGFTKSISPRKSKPKEAIIYNSKSIIIAEWRSLKIIDGKITIEL